ncbi:M23 family metallopeptidase [Desulfonatronovibrio magnus]|uniref:M23 family metallopeptidase n=1 Tax=Desulfonatronovibrio magnus TaxID=698827 RepID=UPI0006976229|nr:M23 family metallopeptidase [Desulfonatronovibrio magnus]
MNYYVPSYKNNSRICLKRKKSKKHLWIISILSILALSYMLMGFSSKSQETETVAELQPGAEVPTESHQSTDSEKSNQTPRPDAVSQHVATQQPSSDDDTSDSAKDTLSQERDTQSVAASSPSIQEKIVSISSGDTLMGLLTAQGLPRAEAHTIISTLQDVFNPRRIRQGQEITLAFETMDQYDPMFQSMNLKLGVTKEVQVERCPENGFVAQEIVRELQTRPVRADAEINSSLYNAAVSAGMPVEVLMQMIRAYSFDVDFQRDIRHGDSFEVLFNEQLDEDGNFIRGGDVLYANLNTRGRTLPIYRYETSDGEVDFFNSKGESVRKTLMVTPIDGARLSSGYGMRRHPILGYSRMHQGLDFAAPTGTPIMAAGDGVVEFAGRRGNYGNLIRLRHPNEYQTLYAHLSRFASGIRQGARVTQGQIIGYVGTTGLSTGPHLHYEVHHRGSHVNPATVDTPPGRTLEGQELEKFLAAKENIQTLFASLEKRDKLARVNQDALSSR